MRTSFVAILAAALWLAPAAASACEACGQDHAAHAAKHDAAHAEHATAAAAKLAPGEARVRIPVTGMHCEHCAERVEAALTKLDGVKRADASLAKGEAVVVFETSKVAAAKLVEAIDAVGYKAGKPVQD